MVSIGLIRAKLRKIVVVSKRLTGMYRNAGHVEPVPTVTKAERDALVKYRARPQPQLRPMPKGMIRADLETNGEKIRERRINHIDTRPIVAPLPMIDKFARIQLIMLNWNCNDNSSDRDERLGEL